MERVPVDSSNLASVGYDKKTFTLEIQFKSGGTYQYYGVPESIHQGLMAAESHGKYFISQVKNTYAYKKVS